MKTLILGMAIGILSTSIKHDEWYVYIPCIIMGMGLIELYHSKWIKSSFDKDYDESDEP